MSIILPRRGAPISRRFALKGLGALMSASALHLTGPGKARATEDEIIRSHGYSFFGNLKYPADYPHFDYVNPDAPKGGEISLYAPGTFDSMNPYSRKGRAGRLSWMVYESLLGGSEATGEPLPGDRYNEGYGLLAESLEYDRGKTWVIFHMRPEARFADGTPVTAHDVVFSHNLFLDQGLRSYAEAVRRRVTGAEALDDHTVRFEFAEGISRRSLIDQVGGTPVFPRAWYEETGARLDEPRLEAAPGSGPYQVESSEVNRSIVYARNPDYWGWHLPINKGRHNFDRIRIEYFADDNAAFEAFKAGIYTFRPEGNSKTWATGYDFPAANQGHVVKAELPDGLPPTPSGFHSFVQDTHLQAEGVPEGAERELLESMGELVPGEMLTEPAVRAHSSDPDRLNDRRNLRQAMRLLDEAGWPVGDDGKRRNAEGELLSIEIPISASGSATMSAVVESFVSNLQLMGIDARFDKIDAAQYTARERERDYDIVFDSYIPFLEAGTGLHQRYGSREAEFSLFNPAGLASPLVDALIDKALESTTKEEQDVALMALDRALRFEFFMIPTWYLDKTWVAYWDQYAHPDPLPQYATGVLDFWWYDAEKAQALRDAGAL